MTITAYIFILFFLVFLSAFFSASETAFISFSNIKIQHLIENNRKGIHLVKKLKDNYERLLITILIGGTLVNIAASSIATYVAIEVFKSDSIGIVVSIMTIIILIFGEIIPKNIAVAENEWIAINSAPLIKLMQYLLYPAIKILELIMMLLSQMKDTEENDPIITQAEIKTVVTIGEEAGEVEEDERIMIHNIFRFSDLHVYEIMIDRMKMFSIDGDEILKNVVELIVKQGYSRIPVYEENPDNIIGILYIKDILQTAIKSSYDIKIKEILRPAMFITESMLIDDLLKEFQKAKVHLAMVVDEHGGISGLITIEDVLEEIVGDIYDETDKEQNMIKKIDENKSLVKGETEIEEVNEVLSLGIKTDGDYETISGFILDQLRYIPEVNENLKMKDYTIRITKADQKRIIEVEIEKNILKDENLKENECT